MKGTLWYAGCDAAALADIERRFEEHLGCRIEFEAIEDKNLVGGFIAHINGVSYDMSMDKRLELLRGALGEGAYVGSVEEYIPALSEKLRAYDIRGEIYEYGTVITSGDGIITIRDLPGCKYGELLEISGGATALAMEITDEFVGAAVLHGEAEIGAQVTRSGNVLSVPVGEAVLGRVLSPTGEPLDGRDPPRCFVRRPIESPAPHIMERSNVSKPLQTGLLSIDSMIPIGRGQRELIIGDRQTGKTTIAVDTILNQKGKDVVCVYCAIGQKASTVAEVVETLTRNEAMSYTVIVSSQASDLPAMQYIAPYSACSIAESFMYSGKDALVVYDDLSKHAVAYRTISLLLHRPPGREAYPGDVFYLHSRLLERSAQLCDEMGGGSLTALPIVETMAGDISAYIPTNIISITDGQIFLESELFHSGMRPAVNVGLSVSRVGRSAQRAAMKKVTGTLRLDLAQYREMSVFLQFGAEVDNATARMLESGVRKNELLKQPKHEPYSLAEEVCLLLAADNGIYTQVPTDEAAELSKRLLRTLKARCPERMAYIENRYDIDADTKAELLDVMRRTAERFAQKLPEKLNFDNP